jgi:uncharacterized membrane protein YfcA
VFLLLPFFAFGLLASYVGSLLGLGGGFLLVPALHLILGVEMKDAIFFSLTSILVISIYHNAKNRELIRSHRKLLIPLALVSVFGSLGGAALQTILVSQALEILFGTFLCAFSIYLFLSRNQAKTPPTEAKMDRLSLVFQSLAGVLSGLFGIGGGIISVPVLNRYLGFDMKEAARLSFFFIFVASVVALIFLLQKRREEIEQIPIAFLMALVVGSVIGAIFGRRHRFSNQFLQRLFSLVIFLIGGIQLLKSAGLFL